jgi:beta-lactam-binding protein with PASTA domain
MMADTKAAPEVMTVRGAIDVKSTAPPGRLDIGVGAAGKTAHVETPRTASVPETTAMKSTEVVDIGGSDTSTSIRRHRSRFWVAAPRRVILLVFLALAATGITVAFIATHHGPPLSVVVPTVTGNPDMAAATLKAVGFEVIQKTVPDTRIPKGQVVRTDPPGQTRAREHSTVTLYVSAGPPIGIVPRLSGPAATATSTLAKAGFRTKTVSEPSGTVPRGHVTRTKPAAGDPAPTGSVVTIYVSTGNVAVPAATDKSKADAIRLIRAAGLKADTVSWYDDTVPAGRVIRTVPAAGAIVAQHSPSRWSSPSVRNSPPGGRWPDARSTRLPARPARQWTCTAPASRLARP